MRKQQFFIGGYSKENTDAKEHQWQILYGFKLLLEKEIDLKKYGSRVKKIFFAPFIDIELVDNHPAYFPRKKEINVVFEIPLDVIKTATDEEYFGILRKGFLNAVGLIKLPEEKFDFPGFKQDVLDLQYENAMQLLTIK